MTFLNVPVHPIAVHVPLAVAVVLPLFALIAIISIRMGWMPARSWAFVGGLAVFGAVSACLAARTGCWEETRVSAVVERSVLHEHKERANVLTMAFVVMAIVSVLPLLPSFNSYHHSLRITAAIGSLVVAALAAWVGKSGGEIVYKYDAPQAYQSPVPSQKISQQSVYQTDAAVPEENPN